jgi:hypothetical protein
MHGRVLTLLAGVLLLAAGSASAQSRDPYFTTFSANYDVIYHETDATSNAGAHFDVASTFKRDVPFIGPVGEVGFNHFEGATLASVMGGLRLRPGNDRQFLPYGQVLVGLYHCGVCNIKDFAIQGGGGVDFRLSDNNNFRIRAQLDVRHVFAQDFGFNAVRVSAGIVLPLNK